MKPNDESEIETITASNSRESSQPQAENNSGVERESVNGIILMNLFTNYNDLVCKFFAPESRPLSRCFLSEIFVQV